MSQLIQILSSIELFLKKHRSSDLEQLTKRPILSPEEIEEEIAELPFKLPEEVIELYEWLHSGHEIFLTMPEGGSEKQIFLNLDKAISLAIEWDNLSTFSGVKVFPLMTVCEVVYWVVGSDDQQDVAPIYSNDDPILPATFDAETLTEFIIQEFERGTGFIL